METKEVDAAKVAVWGEVEAGTRYTRVMALAKYPRLRRDGSDLRGLPSEVARKPKSGTQAGRDVATYAAADVDAIVARRAAPEPVDPRWLEVESGARITEKSAMERYPHLGYRSIRALLKELRSEKARQPKQSDSVFSRAINVDTYLAADVDALAAERAKKRARPAPQEPVPVPVPVPVRAPEQEEEAGECPMCLEPLDLDAATATLVCGHIFRRACIDDWAEAHSTCPCCRAELKIAN